MMTQEASTIEMMDMSMMSPGEMDVRIRPLRENDLAAADTIFRLAFGTFLNLPDPMAFVPGIDFVRPRWRANPMATMGAEMNGKLVGSNFLADWGSLGYFGPLSVHPDFWDKGIGKRMMETTMDMFAEWGTRQLGLVTFPDSPKHLGLYQKFGFWPRFLTALMTKPVEAKKDTMKWSRFSMMTEDERMECLAACREMTDTIHEGLSLEREILSVADQGMGDTLMLMEDKMMGFAICHIGEGTEAGPDKCYVKFGAVRPGMDAEMNFARMMDACEAFAGEMGMSSIAASVNTARQEAYQMMITRGFRAFMMIVAMHRPNKPAYNRPGIYLVDDWI